MRNTTEGNGKTTERVGANHGQAVATGALRHSGDDNYLALVRAFPLRPIRSESELNLGNRRDRIL